MTYFLKVKNFKLLYLWNGKSEGKNVWETFVDFDIGHRMLSLWKLYCDLDLLFEAQQFLHFYISEMVRASEKMSGSLLVDFDICHRIVSLRKL